MYDQAPEFLNNNHLDSYIYGSLGITNSMTTYPSNHNYKHYDFESEYRTADEIVQKINHILDLRSNPKRKDYLAIRERKSHRRKSFTFGPRWVKLWLWLSFFSNLKMFFYILFSSLVGAVLFKWTSCYLLIFSRLILIFYPNRCIHFNSRYFTNTILNTFFFRNFLIIPFYYFSAC